jgi:hypothetical protein
MATVIEQSRGTSDEALVFVRPLNDLGAASAVFHPRDYTQSWVRHHDRYDGDYRGPGEHGSGA